jgi:hypothetical protein
MFDDFGVSCSHFFCGKHPISSRSGCPFRYRSLAFINAMALQLHGFEGGTQRGKDPETEGLEGDGMRGAWLLFGPLGWKILHGVWGCSYETMMENLQL